MPALSQAAQLYRRECSEQFWGMNTFVFLMNCRSADFEDDCLTALEEMIKIIGYSFKFMGKQAFEIRFTNKQRMRISTLQRLAACFGSMHMLGLKRVAGAEDRILRVATISDTNEDLLFRTVVNYMFTLGGRLSKMRCTRNKKRAPARRMLDCESHDHLRVQFDRFTQCRNSKCKADFFMHPDVLELLKRFGLKLRRVRATCSLSIDYIG
jgi:hypothetical protein